MKLDEAQIKRIDFEVDQWNNWEKLYFLPKNHRLSKLTGLWTVCSVYTLSDFHGQYINLHEIRNNALVCWSWFQTMTWFQAKGCIFLYIFVRNHKFRGLIISLVYLCWFLPQFKIFLNYMRTWRVWVLVSIYNMVLLIHIFTPVQY